jgi:hypothetical protein
MKLLFLILAHDRPEDAAELARTLVAAAADARALIHFDARAEPAAFAALAAAVAGEPRVGLVAKRVACRWGGFGLVEAPLNALAQAEAEGMAPDYAILLSGACLPCRPLATLERYLGENAGREFIESEDERWVTGGWREERWRFWHVFDHRTQNVAEHLSARLQKALGVRRRFPPGLEPRFGSQWWALTWPVCQAILADVRRSPRRLRFFRSVWIPDEMLFQTYVHALVPEAAIAGFGLTHFQFTNRGKPVVFHDDHGDYVRTLERFFVRKASPEARRLRAACLARAAEPDDGAPLAGVGARRRHYPLKIWAQTRYRPPGALFFDDQQWHRIDPILAADETPYLVVIGPPERARRLVARLPEPPFTVLGEIFAPGRIDFGRGRAELGGLRARDVAIRDLHPALWLTRVRARARALGGVPVLPWSPADSGRLLAAVIRDPAALVVTLPPRTGDPARDRAALMVPSLGRVRRRTAGLPLGVPEGALARAVFEAGGGPGPDLALWMVAGMSPPSTRGVPLLPPPGYPRTGFPEWIDAGPPLPPPDLVLPWGGAAAAAARARRRRELAAGLAACRFRDAAWFPALAAALAAAADAADAAGEPARPAAAGAPGPAALPEPADGCR